jgi:dCMP deaminase
MKDKLKHAYLQTAFIFSKLSHARRLHVGAIIVKDDRIVSIGYNGMPAGWDNNCEDKEWMDRDAGGWLSPDEIYEQWPHVEYNEDAEEEYRYRLVTKPEVLHAETNAIAKLAKSNESGLDATMFITHAPCLDCAKLIYQSGINSVFYRDAYRNEAGIQFLKQSGVTVEKLDIDGQ